MSARSQVKGRDVAYDEVGGAWRYCDTAEFVEFNDLEKGQFEPENVKPKKRKSWREIFIVLCMVFGAYTIGLVIGSMLTDWGLGEILVRIVPCILLSVFFVKALRRVHWAILPLLLVGMVLIGGCSHAWNKSSVDSKGGNYQAVDGPVTEINIEWERAEK